jgi:hypothetical protein
MRCIFLRLAISFVTLGSLAGSFPGIGIAGEGPAPLLEKGGPVDWWFVFKFNTASFPACRAAAKRVCLFGGDVQEYAFGQQFAYASSENKTLRPGEGCAGDTVTDPVGATFDQLYNASFFYVVWNDQFYDDPHIEGCSQSCGAPWGHSKGMLAWDGDGEGVVMQVTTPSWPASGSKNFPREADGNTLGCVSDDNVKVSQHFFSLRLHKDGVIKVLHGLENASVVTDPGNPQVVHNGGPLDIQRIVKRLGQKSDSNIATREPLSSGFDLISKPSQMNVPPWQMVSSFLGGVSLRTATWWATPKIYSTTESSRITCWDANLNKPGPVEIASSGQFEGKTFGLTGGPGPNNNHAKIGVSTSGDHPYVIFGDMNQQGAISGNCSSSQNGRGGLFFVIEDADLAGSVGDLISGDTAPTRAPSTDR